MAGVPAPVVPLVEELAFLRLPVRAEQEEQLARTAQSTVAALVDRHLLRQKADLVRQLQRTEGGGGRGAGTGPAEAPCRRRGRPTYAPRRIGPGESWAFSARSRGRLATLARLRG